MRFIDKYAQIFRYMYVRILCRRSLSMRVLTFLYNPAGLPRTRQLHIDTSKLLVDVRVHTHLNFKIAKHILCFTFDKAKT